MKIKSNKNDYSIRSKETTAHSTYTQISL